MEKISDEALINKIRSGSKSAYGQLMERYERLVFKVAVSCTRNVDDAMDITQDVFLKTWQKLDLYHGTGSFKAWLVRIAHNESISWLRRQRRFEDYDRMSPDNAPRHGAEQESRLIESERRRMMQKEILKLNSKQQVAVTLRYFDGMPIRQIAGVLECSEGNVKSILFRSLEKMRNGLHAQRRKTI